MKPIRCCALVLLASLLVALWPHVSGASSSVPPSSPPAALTTQLVPPATIRVKHDVRNDKWTDWPVGEIRVFPFEEYVKRVVSCEVYWSWPMETLKAQAVAARTCGWFWVRAHQNWPFDVSDFADYQMMCSDIGEGISDAVDATSGQYIAYGGDITFCEYSAENSDPTLDSSVYPYMRGVEDPVSFGETRRGHGHGLSQWGAQRWASIYNWDYQKILMHYYTGVSVELPQGATPDSAPPMASVVLPWSSWYVTGSRVFLSGNASDAASGVARSDFTARFASGVTATIGSDANANGGWSAAWDVSSFADQPLASPVVLSMTVRDGAGNVAAGAPARIGLDRSPPTVTAALDLPYGGGPTVTLRLSGGDVGSGLAAMALSNDWLWEGEGLAYPGTGAAVSDTAALNGSAWRARAGLDPAGAVFGPFTTVLTDSQYIAYFRLKTTSPLTTAVIARLDVITSSVVVTGQPQTTGILGLHEVRGGDFRAAGQYQEMAVRFDHITATQQLEFRTHFLGVSDLYLDRVLIVAYPTQFVTRTVWTIGDGALPRTVRVKSLDAAGNVSPDAIVIVGGTPAPTVTPSGTPTLTGTPGATLSPTRTPTTSPSAPPGTATPTPTGASASPTSSRTPTLTATMTATALSPTPTLTPTVPATATATPGLYTKTPTSTHTATPAVSGVRLALPLILSDYLSPPTATATRGPAPVCTPGVAATFGVGSEPHGVAIAAGRLYVANFTGMGLAGTVSVLNSTTGQSIVPPIAVGLAPNGVAYNPANGMVYVTNRDSNNVSVIDTASNRVVATVAVGAMPNGVAVDAGVNRVYVANWGSNDVSVIDGSSNITLGGRISVGSEPAMIAANSATGLVYVVNHGSSSLSVIRSSDGVLAQTISLPGLPAPYGVAVNSLTNRIYVVGIVAGRMALIDGATGSLLGMTAPAPGLQLWQAAALAATNHIVVTSSGGLGAAYVFDAETGQWLPGVWPVGVSPEQGIAADAATGRVYIANAGSDSVTVLRDCLSR